ncbi:hypothetical protein DAE87_004576 [Salmonella enterica subsp. enterica serovar Braenderup]|nr:hypothetical protein [Salmonella enterica subsp. enterica serovar Braenderup]
MDINQKFIDDVIISLMEMNDRLVALEEMAAEHVAEHEEAAAEAQYKADILAAMPPLQDSFTKTAPKAAFLSGNGVIGAEIENKFKQPAPQIKEKRKTFFDGMAFVLENMKDRDDAARILNHFAEMNSGETA